jgi:uncharacterized protein YbjQ (UPF0145 family)
MNRLNNILVTTTGSVEGLKIIRYIKPVSAHIVTGTNIFNDFFAGLTDVFGGRSGTYQRQLASIYEEATENLKTKALESGANCILNLRVDCDEISGKGKSMFMITATGTAVVIENASDKIERMTDEKLSFISIERMEMFRKRKEFVKLAKNKFCKEDGTLAGNINEIIDFITVNAVSEIAREVIDYILVSDTYPKILAYLDSLNTNFVTDLLFAKLMNENSEGIYLLFNLFKDLRIYDAERLIAYLKSENELYKHRAIELVVNDKAVFSKEDTVMYEKIIQTIKSSFKEVVTYSKAKGLFSREREIWICSCGTKNEPETDYCTFAGCNKDKYGFSKDKVNPVKAIKKLEENIEIIRENLM